MSENNPSIEKGKSFTRRERRLTFYILMFAIPLLQFLIFYIYVNFNSIIIAFQEKTENLNGLGYNISFTLDNFKNAFAFFASERCGKMIWNSIQLLIGQLVIVTPLALLFSYYIAKEKPGSAFFRIMLYLPQVLSVVVLGILYQEIMSDGYREIAMTLFKDENAEALMQPGSSYNAKFYGALIFTLWFSFGSNVLIYTGAMSGVDQSIVESAQLDGVTSFEEFFHIYVPMIFSTVTTFVITGLAGIFNNQMSLHTFFGNTNEVQVFGYHFYGTAAMYLAGAGGLTIQDFHVLAAEGLIATLIVIPVTLIVRGLMNKYGPSVD